MRKAFWVVIITMMCVMPSLAQDRQEEQKKAVDFYVGKIRSDPENFALHRELVEMYHEKGFISIPIEIYKNSLEKFPTNPTVNYVFGYANLFEGSPSALKLAEKSFKIALEAKPQFPDALTALGDCYLKMGKPEMALQYWDEAVDIDSKFDLAYLSLARYYRSRREYDKAVEEYQKAISASKRNTGKVYLELGLMYMDMGNLDRVEKALLNAKRYDSKNGIVYFKLGQVYAKKGERDKAAEMYSDGRKYDPYNAKAAYELAHIFIETNDLKYALMSMERALTFDGADPKVTKELITRINKGIEAGADFLNQLAGFEYSDNAQLHYFLGKLYLKLGNDDLALKYLTSATALDPSNSDAHYQLGLIYEKLRPEEADEQYRRAAETGASEAELLFKVAQGYLDEGLEAKFIETAQKALAIDPKRADVHLQLAEIFKKRAEIYRNTGQKDKEDKALSEAIKYYEQVVALQPDAEKWYQLGLLYEKADRGVKPVRAYDQAIQLKPDFAMAYYRRGHFRLNYKVGSAKVLMYQPDVAVEDLKKAIELDPKLADAHFSLGMAYHQMNMPELATAEFAKAVESDPKNFKAHVYLAQDYSLAGENEKAIYHLSKAVELDDSDVEVLKDYASMLLKFGSDADVIPAREALEKAYKLKPDDPEVLMNYGYTLYLGRMFNEAVEKLNKALEIQPFYPEAHYNIALAYSSMGNNRLALEHWEKVKQQSPQSSMANKAEEFIQKTKSLQK